MSVLSSANTLTSHNWRLGCSVPTAGVRACGGLRPRIPPGHDGPPVRAGPTHDHLSKMMTLYGRCRLTASEQNTRSDVTFGRIALNTVLSARCDTYHNTLRNRFLRVSGERRALSPVLRIVVRYRFMLRLQRCNLICYLLTLRHDIPVARTRLSGGPPGASAGPGSPAR